MGGKIVVVPGLAVRRYAAAPVERLRQAGYEVDLRPGLAWRGVPVDVAAYGRQLGADIAAAGEPVDVLVGLSAGTQAAAVAAAVTPLVRRLVLVSPTFDPDRRSTGKMLASYLKPNPNENVPVFSEQLPDWSKAGLHRILRGFRSAVGLATRGRPARGDGGADDCARRLRPADQLRLRCPAGTPTSTPGCWSLPSGSHSWPTKDYPRGSSGWSTSW